MRLTDLISTLVADAITTQAQLGEAVDYDVSLAMVNVPGGQVPEITILVAGYSSQGDHIVAPPITIQGATTTAGVVGSHVATALTWLRAR